MFCPYKNSYLQLQCALNPQVFNKAVRRAMRKTQFDPHDEKPPAQRLESMQPSLFAPWVDITRARQGFGRTGLRTISNQLHSDDNLIQLQSLHTIMDQVQISENAMQLIKLNITYRLIDMMTHPDPIAREKVLLTLTHLASYYQGRQRIMARSVFIDRLIFMFMRDRKEIRYAAAFLLKTLTQHRCACEIIMKNDKIVESLLKMIKNDHVGTVILHMNSLTNLSEWDPIKPLKENAFQVMRRLMVFHQYRVVQAALDCMIQLCKHDVGKKLADNYDMTKILQSYLVSPDIQVVISAVGLMGYTTLTTKSKWRSKEFTYDLIKRLIALCETNSIPLLQMRAMQVLINLCDCTEIRVDIKRNYESNIKKLSFITAEQWDGSTVMKTIGLKDDHSGHYRMVSSDNVRMIRNPQGEDGSRALNVHNYLRRARHMKFRLLKAMKLKSYVKIDDKMMTLNQK